MSFWNTSTGENLASQEAPREYETGGGDLTPIPDGSTVLAYIKEAKWEETKNFENYIKLRWDVLEPASVAKRVVFQKLWVKDDDPNAKDPAAKRDKALRMLATIDANAGGKLAAKGSEPTDDELLVALADKPMAITVRVWQMKGSDGTDKEGNWISAVAPKGKELVVKDEPAKAKDEPLDDEIPW